MTRIEAAGYERGELSLLTAPSLFGEPKMVIFLGTEAMNDDFQRDIGDYFEHPEPDVTVLLHHRKGSRGLGVLRKAKAAGAVTVACEPLKNDAQKLSFVSQEVKRAKRQITRDAAQHLVDVLGSDLAEMAGALSALMADVQGRITIEHVRTYYGMQIEADSFDVVGAAVAGNAQQAITLVRHAFAAGAKEPAIIGALAAKLRTMAKAQLLASGEFTAADLGINPRQLPFVRQELRSWSAEGLARAIIAVAAADQEVKGGSRDPQFAVERALLRVAFYGAPRRR